MDDFKSFSTKRLTLRLLHAIIKLEIGIDIIFQSQLRSKKGGGSHHEQHGNQVHVAWYRKKSMKGG